MRSSYFYFERRQFVVRGAFIGVALAALIGMATPQAAQAFTCDSVTNPAGGNSSASDQVDAENTACGTSASAGFDDGISVHNGKASAFGWDAGAFGAESVAVGANAQTGLFSTGGIAIGRNALVQDEVNFVDGSEYGIAIGRNALVSDDYAVALGESSAASGDGALALGKSSIASGDRAVALGRGAVAANLQSTAIGAGAVTTNDNQVVLGTTTETYTTPGITSDLSRSRQTGPLQIVTTDADGNLASDGGALSDRVSGLSDRLDSSNDKNADGSAMAMAMANPDLTGDEKFGMSFNYGNFDGASAVAGAVTGVVWEDDTTRFAVSGGLGYGFQLQYSWWPGWWTAYLVIGDWILPKGAIIGAHDAGLVSSSSGPFRFWHV